VSRHGFSVGPRPRVDKPKASASLNQERNRAPAGRASYRVKELRPGRDERHVGGVNSTPRRA
jgi:hypothetical protein